MDFARDSREQLHLRDDGGAERADQRGNGEDIDDALRQLRAAFNSRNLVASCEPRMFSRWTCLHVRQLTKSIKEGGFTRRGFRFIEVIARARLVRPPQQIGTGFRLDGQFYHDSAEVRHDADTQDVAIRFQDAIICGNSSTKSGRLFSS